MGQFKPAPHCAKTEQDLQDDIEKPVHTEAVTYECDGFVAERRESSKSAQDAEKTEETYLLGQPRPGFTQAPEKTDNQTTHDIDHHGSVGHPVLGKPALYTGPNEITKGGTDKKNLDHRAYLRG